MNEFRITKYNPEYRQDGVYLKHEWTSISDIGEDFDDGVLSLEDYLKVENAYIQCCLETMEIAGISTLSISCPEVYAKDLLLPQSVSINDSICEIIRWCLREKCWAKLEAKSFFIHFGYDYYMYIGTELPMSTVMIIANRYNLFCESYHSPYSP